MADLPENADLVGNAPNSLSAAARIGAGMRDVRERLGWKLPEVAERIRIRAVFLTAIEEGDLSSLPGAAYRTGFVRSYAQTLGLDGEEILERFRNAGQIEEVQREELKLLTPIPDRGVPKGAIILIGLIIIICGYGFWYHHTEQMRKMAQNAIQIPAKLQPLAVPAKVTPPPAQAAAPTATTPPASSTGTATTNATTPSDSTPQASSPVASTALPASDSSKPAATSTSLASTPAAASPTTTPNPATSNDSATAPSPTDTNGSSQAPVASASAAGLTITATQPSWIQVTAPNGTILFSKVLNAGQSWPVPQMPGLKLTTGNAGGTVISTDGNNGQPLGAPGVVLHNYQLTPPAQGSAAPPASSSATPATP